MVYKPKEQQREDYQTIHPGVIGQPDFNFLPAGMKIARIDEYHRVKRELEKTREIREMLQGADKNGAQTQRNLMNDPSQLDNILAHLDADKATREEYGKVSDLWFMDRYKKIQTSINGLVSKIVNEDLGIDQINHSNLE